MASAHWETDAPDVSVAPGAAGAVSTVTRLHASATRSVLRMDVYAFTGRGDASMAEHAA